MKRDKGFGRLFNPSSVAMIGASKNERKGGGLFLRSLINGGFKGKLYPVNPGESELVGLSCYPSILDIPGEVDLAILTVPAGVVPRVMAECSQKGVGFAIVHSAGFSELGTKGQELEEEMLRFARQGGIRIIGPNCMGFYCAEAGINTVIPHSNLEKEPGSVGFVGQSGWVSENFILTGYERGLRFSKAVSIGNQSDITIEDLLEYFADEPKTRIIVCYIEGVKEGGKFLQVAKQVSKKKPIIVWKAGRTEAGIKAVASHTGSLAGNNVIFDAALKQGGIVIAKNLDELIDLAVGFTCPILPAGNKLGLLVEAGGGAVASADAAEALGLKMPTLSARTQQELADKLKDIIPPFSGPKNPLDLVWVPANDGADIYLWCARVMLEEVNAVVLLAYADLDDYFTARLVSLRDRLGKPIFIIPGHPLEQRTGMSLLAKNGISTFTMPERALRVLSAMVDYYNYLRQN